MNISICILILNDSVSPYRDSYNSQKLATLYFLMLKLLCS